MRAAVVAAGVFYTFSGAALFFAPRWFFDNIGTYPPFNRHYGGDLGAFLLPMGLALLLAARNPLQHRLLIGMVLAGSILHTINHIYDEMIVQFSVSQIMMGTLPLLIFVVVLGLAYATMSPRRAV